MIPAIGRVGGVGGFVEPFVQSAVASPVPLGRQEHTIERILLKALQGATVEDVPT